MSKLSVINAIIFTKFYSYLIIIIIIVHSFILLFYRLWNNRFFEIAIITWNRTYAGYIG